jgi:hypothetical protein
MKYEIEESKAGEIMEQITEFDKLLTERISDLHEVPGMMQARHAYIFYREHLWKIRDLLRFNLKEIKSAKK